ncbi:ATP-binding protein [Pseudonocardia yunnanensis]|uniref:ATP-binding protein n=1 Tax=Pseudonocardia yunnanensis TaxID=58107 RepID=A0ABW4FCR0_9PSEU
MNPRPGRWPRGTPVQGRKRNGEQCTNPAHVRPAGLPQPRWRIPTGQGRGGTPARAAGDRRRHQLLRPGRHGRRPRGDAAAAAGAGPRSCARTESWTHEEFLAACLQREVAAREAHGGEGRIRAARFPVRESLEDFDFDHQRSLKRETISHLGTLDFITARENEVFLGPPGTGKTHCETSVGCSNHERPWCRLRL